MKPFSFRTMILSLVFLMSTFGAFAGDRKPAMKNIDKTELSPEALTMVNRVEEIQKMDFSTLNVAERKALKQELKGIKHELKATQGIYFSIGAIVIIILLLILIL